MQRGILAMAFAHIRCEYRHPNGLMFFTWKPVLMHLVLSQDEQVSQRIYSSLSLLVSVSLSSSVLMDCFPDYNFNYRNS